MQRLREVLGLFVALGFLILVNSPAEGAPVQVTLDQGTASAYEAIEGDPEDPNWNIFRWLFPMLGEGDHHHGSGSMPTAFFDWLWWIR